MKLNFKTFASEHSVHDRVGFVQDGNWQSNSKTGCRPVCVGIFAGAALDWDCWPPAWENPQLTAMFCASVWSLNMFYGQRKKRHITSLTALFSSPFLNNPPIKPSQCIFVRSLQNKIFLQAAEDLPVLLWRQCHFHLTDDFILRVY